MGGIRKRMHLERCSREVQAGYQAYIRRKVVFIIACLAVLILLALVSIAVGSVTLPINEVVDTLLTRTGDTSSLIIWNIRLPRVMAAIIAGAGLGVAGAVMQSIMRNPLSSPYTMGISNAAAFGAACAIVLFGAGMFSSSVAAAVTVSNPFTVTVCAFAASLAATLVLLALSKFGSFAPEVMILVGVALAALFTAATTFLQFFSNELQLAAIVFWTFGDVGRVTWIDLAILSLVTVPVICYFMLNRWNYNALDAGDETATGLGVNVVRIRFIGMFLSSLITAVVVSFMGIIGFIGLVCPHITRRVIGDDERFVIPSAVLVGSITLLFADTLARIILSPVVLPVGIITAFFGAPLFLYLLVGRRKV
jgi:iron complex transport system permease protein